VSNKWLAEGSLVYRLNEEGENCDEINISMYDDSRDAVGRGTAAKHLAVILNAIIAGEIITIYD
jgi:hypothetical protein